MTPERETESEKEKGKTHVSPHRTATVERTMVAALLGNKTARPRERYAAVRGDNPIERNGMTGFVLMKCYKSLPVFCSAASMVYGFTRNQ